MLSGLLQRLLLQQCSNLLEACSPQQISLWRSSVVMTDVKLKKEILYELFGLEGLQ